MKFMAGMREVNSCRAIEPSQELVTTTKKPPPEGGGWKVSWLGTLRPKLLGIFPLRDEFADALHDLRTIFAIRHAKPRVRRA
jgi:hypothetical protein